MRQTRSTRRSSRRLIAHRGPSWRVDPDSDHGGDPEQSYPGHQLTLGGSILDGHNGVSSSWPLTASAAVAVPAEVSRDAGPADAEAQLDANRLHVYHVALELHTLCSTLVAALNRIVRDQLERAAGEARRRRARTSRRAAVSVALPRAIA